MNTLELNTQKIDFIRAFLNEENTNIVNSVVNYFFKEKKSQSVDNTCMSKEDFFAKIDNSLQQAEDGRYTEVSTKEELLNYLNNL